MSYTTISLEGFLQEFQSVSGGSYPRRFCFVLGAGASKASGIKTGEELVNQWDRELEVRIPEEHARWKQETGITPRTSMAFTVIITPGASPGTTGSGTGTATTSWSG